MATPAFHRPLMQDPMGSHHSARRCHREELVAFAFPFSDFGHFYLMATPAFHEEHHRSRPGLADAIASIYVLGGLGASWGLLGKSLGPLGDLLGGLGAILGASWGVLGASWGPLGGSWEPLGCSWGCLWHLLGGLWGLLATLGEIFGVTWGVFGASWGPSGCQKAPKRDPNHNKNDPRTLFFYSDLSNAFKKLFSKSFRIARASVGMCKMYKNVQKTSVFTVF